MTRKTIIYRLRILLANRCSSCRHEFRSSAICAKKCQFMQAIDMAIEALKEVQKHKETFEWRSDCKEFDKENYCCHRWSKEIRNTVEELKSVVRCKDCKYKRLYDEGETKYYYCALEDRPNRNWSVDDTDYCSWGERREP